MNDREYLEARVRRDENGCWLWQGVVLQPSGYGQANCRSRRSLAHRLAFETFRGPIPSGLTLDHLCRVRACVNPDHLEPVTGWENVQRAHGNPVADNVGKLACPRGHSYTHVDQRGWRKCRECANESRQAKRRERGAPLAQALRMHCPHGHPYDAENTRVTTRGKRACRACERSRNRARRARAKGAEA